MSQIKEEEEVDGRGGKIKLKKSAESLVRQKNRKIFFRLNIFLFAPWLKTCQHFFIMSFLLYLCYLISYLWD